MPRVSDARNRLILAACQLITTRSYTSVGVQQICKQAKVNKGSFYHFFPTKSDLAVAALDKLWDEHKQSSWEPAFEFGPPGLSALQAFLGSIVQDSKSPQGELVCGCPFGNLAAELSTLDETIRVKVESIFDDMKAYIRDALYVAAAQNDVDDLDVEALAATVLCCLQGAWLVAKAEASSEEVRRVVPVLLKLVETQLGGSTESAVV